VSFKTSNRKLAGAALCSSSVLLCFAAFTASGQTAEPVALPVVGGGLPAVGPSILRVLGALALVVALFFGGVWLFRNWQRLSVRRGSAPKLSVIEVKSLGQRQALFVVGYEKQRMLVATSPAGVSLLGHLPEAELETAKEPTPAPRLSFAEALQHVLSAKS
jgi:flagellar biogenesis protein FliO